MAIKIITDSTSDISLDDAKSLGIEIIPLNIHFGEETYKDGYEISTDEFFNKLVNSDIYPKTSQVNIDEFHECFKRHIDNGDKVIGIFISSDLSGTFQSSKIAKEMLDNKDITVIDSRIVSIALKTLVIKAVQLRDEGKSYNDLIEEIEKIKNKVKLFTILEDLTFLKKGGRLSGTAATVGNVLSIKPILTCDNGKVIVLEKCRGSKAAYERLVTLAVENNIANSEVICVGHGFSEDKFTSTKDTLKKSLPNINIIDSRLGPTVGLYSGPKCIGIACIKN